jgi:hypothetical protein
MCLRCVRQDYNSNSLGSGNIIIIIIIIIFFFFVCCLQEEKGDDDGVGATRSRSGSRNGPR